MQRFESSRLSQRVRLQRVTYEGRSKTAWYREVSQISAELYAELDRRKAVVFIHQADAFELHRINIKRKDGFVSSLLNGW